jgi:hypothetical protein
MRHAASLLYLKAPSGYSSTRMMRNSQRRCKTAPPHCSQNLCFPMVGPFAR